MPLVTLGMEVCYVLMLTGAHILRSFRRKSVRRLGVQPCIIYCLRELPTHLYFLYLYEKYIFNFCPVLDWTYRGFYHSFYYFWPYALRIIQGFSVIFGPSSSVA